MWDLNTVVGALSSRNRGDFVVFRCGNHNRFFCASNLHRIYKLPSYYNGREHLIRTRPGWLCEEKQCLQKIQSKLWFLYSKNYYTVFTRRKTRKAANSCIVNVSFRSCLLCTIKYYTTGTKPNVSFQRAGWFLSFLPCDLVRQLVSFLRHDVQDRYTEMMAMQCRWWINRSIGNGEKII